jgi:hypothetical protein
LPDAAGLPSKVLWSVFSYRPSVISFSSGKKAQAGYFQGYQSGQTVLSPADLIS